MYNDPYEKYYPREPINLGTIQRKWFNRLCKTMSGNFLDVTTLVALLLSYTSLDYRDNWLFLQIKSFVIGIVNLFICLYFIIFILLEDRLTLFPKVAKILAGIEKMFICLQLCSNDEINDMMENEIEGTPAAEQETDK